MFIFRNACYEPDFIAVNNDICISFLFA